MNFSFKNSLLGGALLLLLVLQSTVAKADDDKSKSKPKKETKYDRLFKDKKTETARSKFITVHKLDNKIYFELPRTLLKKQMMNHLVCSEYKNIECCLGRNLPASVGSQQPQ